ncbi:MAG: hypothetical protein LBT40_12030, partial [Deltaproteobacteria bacterium]|nr:hypothetical protein [Deltaproteobacteria bacterium]
MTDHNGETGEGTVAGETSGLAAGGISEGNLENGDAAARDREGAMDAMDKDMDAALKGVSAGQEDCNGTDSAGEGIPPSAVADPVTEPGASPSAPSADSALAGGAVQAASVEQPVTEASQFQ